MRRTVNYLTLFLLVFISGCRSQWVSTQFNNTVGYSYIAITPIPVSLDQWSTDQKKQLLCSQSNNFLDFLPDYAVRTSIQRVGANGNVQFGVGSADGDFKSQTIVVDYVNSDTATIPFYIQKRMKKYESRKKPSEHAVAINPYLTDLKGYWVGSEEYSVTRDAPFPGAKDLTVQELNQRGWHRIGISFYIGIGTRASATVEEASGGINASGLGAIGFEVEAESLRGTLSLESLGINNRKINSLIPIQSELSRSSTQQAILAIHDIKKTIDEVGSEDTPTKITPRVIGMYIPMPADAKLANAVISAVSLQSISWPPPLTKQPDMQQQSSHR